MFTTAIITFREFLEAFLLIGIFIGIDKKLNLGKQKEIISAACIGIFISLILPIIVFFFASDVSNAFTEKNTNALEGYFLTFSGFFMAYVVFSLHKSMKNYRKKTISNAKDKMEQQIFDISLFFTLVFFIAREGFEVALLIATTSLFSAFWLNLGGLLLGFILALAVGLSTIITYIKLPIRKVFQYTEYIIIIMGAAMVMNGLSILSKTYFNISLERYIPLPLGFLPNDSSFLGHLLKNTLGLQKEMGILQIALMVMYVIIINILFLKTKKIYIAEKS